jgi:hypothetical protein
MSSSLPKGELIPFSQLLPFLKIIGPTDVCLKENEQFGPGRTVLAKEMSNVWLLWLCQHKIMTVF